MMVPSIEIFAGKLAIQKRKQRRDIQQFMTVDE